MRIGWRVIVTTFVAGAVVAGTVLVGWTADRVARDRAFVIDSFDRLVEVEADGTTRVTESIDVTFLESRRGIFRDLPDERRMPAGDWSVLSVDRGTPDEPWTAVVESGPDGPRVRIGDASVWLDPGTYHYRLRLLAPTWSHVLARDPDTVETRVDVPGFDWPTDVERVRLTLDMPGPITQARCVEGRLGSRRACGSEPVVDGNRLVLELGPYPDRHSATVAVHVPTSSFVTDLPARHPEPLTGGVGLPQADIGRVASAVLYAALLALALLSIDVVYARHVYRDQVTDPHLHDRAHPAAVPAPPLGLRSAEVAGLLLRRDAQSLFLATLVDLSQRDVLHTEATATGKGQGLTVRRGDAASDPDDQAFVDALLDRVDSITFGDAYDAAVARRVQAATRVVHRRASHVFEQHGLTHSGGVVLRSPAFRVFLTLGVIVWIWVTGRIVATVTPLSGGALAAVAAVVVVGWGLAHAPWGHHRVPLNSQGRDATGHARAFRSFIETVEGDQLRWAAGQPGIGHRHPAVTLLPYAIALGLADSWFRRFGEIMAQFATASAASGGVAWWASGSTFSSVRTAQSTTSTPPSSSGSGGGGGGGSGGGGGGGGSW